MDLGGSKTFCYQQQDFLNILLESDRSESAMATPAAGIAITVIDFPKQNFPERLFEK
ncbi:hypothetical protein [Nostoc sp.]|uniref:hypothetical protein n=1 Tax=Nostoc sp. TaxID=1180 RepID=UPI002FF44BB3